MSELEAISRLCLRSKGYWGYDEVFLEACRDVLTVTPQDLANDHLQVAVLSDRLVGVAHLQVKRQAVLDKLFIETDAIGCGAGRQLFNWAAETAKSLGVTSMSIDADPEAESFYTKMGARTVRHVPSEAIVGRQLPQMEMDLV